MSNFESTKEYLLKLSALLLTVTLLTFNVGADEFVLVKSGEACPDAVFWQKSKANQWQAREGVLQVSGMNRILASRYKFGPENIKLSLAASFDKLDGTAASVVFGGGHFLLDTREGIFLVEGTGFEKLKDYEFAASELKAGTRFLFELTIVDGKISFKINGKTLGQLPCENRSPIFLGVRPHRATMKIYDMKITGTRKGYSDMDEYFGTVQTRPTITEPVSINRDTQIRVFVKREPEAGETKAKLVSLLDGKTYDADASVILSQNTTEVKLSHKDLEKAYSASPDNFVLKPFRLVIGTADECVVDNTLTLYNPSRTNNFPEGQIITYDQVPEIHINGKSNGMMMGPVVRHGGSYIFRGDCVKQFSDAGCRIFPMYVCPYYFMGKNDEINWDSFLADFEEYITRFVSEAPEGRLLLRWRLWMDQGWCDRHPAEAIKLDTGEKSISNTPGGKLQPSYASLLWKKQAGEILQKALKKIQATPYADRIAAIQLCYGNCGEWNHWGYHQKAFVDFSAPMQMAFGSWLKNKYTTIEKLRATWGNENASFDSPVPNRKERLEKSNVLFRKLPGGQSSADYYEFFSEYTVDDIEYFARIVKECSDSRLLAGAFYGYYIGHIASAPYHFQDSGHYALRKYLESPYLDFLCGPYPYYKRRENAVPNGACASVALHGKIWLSENDQRTHRSGEANKIYGTTDNLQESIAILRRDFMQNLGKQCGYYFYDFIQGWYSDPEFMDEVTRLRKIDRLSKTAGRAPKAQVAIFVNESGVPYISNRPESRMAELFRMFTHELDAAGAPWQMFLLSDIDKVDLSQYKLLIFPDAFRLSMNDARNIVQKARGGNRTLLWLYAPAIVSPENGGIDPEFSKNVTGIKIGFRENVLFRKLSPENSRIKSELVALKNVPGFMTFIADKKAKTFGRLDVDNLPVAASRKFRNWRSVVICFPSIDRHWLREMYRQAGVQLWVKETFPVFHVAGPFAGVYTRSKGRHIVNLPQRVELVYDLMRGRVVAKNTNTIIVNSPEEPYTGIYYYGKAALLTK